MKPFRWNLEKEEQLGRLTEGERSEGYPEFASDLRECCSRLLSYSDDGVLAFVGRSPESIYDYLSGVLGETSKAGDLVLINISNRYEAVLEMKVKRPFVFHALKEHFVECGIAPGMIISRKKRTVFADLVAKGGTFGQVATFLFSWADEEGLSLKDLRLKLGFLGVTWRMKTSPNTWRWYQQVSWVDELQIRNIKSVSVPGRLWTYLGNYQRKVSDTNRPEQWGSESMLEPPREEWNLTALRQAFDLYRQGRGERKLFSELLGKENAISEGWLRKLNLELRRISGGV